MSATKQEIVQHEASPPATETGAVLSIIDRASRDPAIDIDKMQRLLDMQKTIIDDERRMAFNRAMREAQAEMGPIRANMTNDQTNSRYASYAALDAAIRPIYTRHGFSVSFNSGVGAPDEHVRVLCDVEHDEGFTKQFHVDMPADGKGAKGGNVMTKTHAAGSAFSYGQRYLQIMVWNLAVQKDDDGNAADGPIRLNMNQAKFWLRMEEIIHEIRNLPTFKRINNMRDRLREFTFLPEGFSSECLKECDEREVELDQILAGKKQPSESEPAEADRPTDATVLWEFCQQLEGVSCLADIAELQDDYGSRLDGAPDETWEKFNEMVAAAEARVPNVMAG